MNMNIDQEPSASDPVLANVESAESADVSIHVVPDAQLAAYVEALGVALGVSVDVSADGESDYLDDMVASEPTVDVEAAVSADVDAVAIAAVPVDGSVSAAQDIDDSEFLETKLRGYAEVTDLKLLYPGDHMRITQNKYRQSGRKCSYLVMKRYDAAAGVWWVNGFKSSYPDWQISVKPLNRYKQVRFYRKIPTPHTGRCHGCTRKVKAPYNLCYDCRNERRN